MERRLQSRVPSQTKVRLYFNVHGRMEGRLSDFSQGGVFIHLDKKYQLPESGDIVVMLADNMDEPYTMTAVRSKKRKLALMFND